MNSNKINENSIQYVLQLSALKKLKKLNRINDETFELMKIKLKQFYKMG